MLAFHFSSSAGIQFSRNRAGVTTRLRFQWGEEGRPWTDRASGVVRPVSPFTIWRSMISSRRLRTGTGTRCLRDRPHTGALGAIIKATGLIRTHDPFVESFGFLFEAGVKRLGSELGTAAAGIIRLALVGADKICR